MRGVAKMLEYKQKRNNGRTPFAGVYKFGCVCGCMSGTCKRHVGIYAVIGTRPNFPNTQWLGKKGGGQIRHINM